MSDPAAGLLPETLRPRLEPLGGEPPEREGDAQRAAVTMVLRPRPEPGVLFVQRARVAGDPWSGHMALPGGRMEPEDGRLLATARRELHEEVGLDLPVSAFLGELSPVRPSSGSLPGISIAPFVAWWEGEARIRANREIAGHLWVPVFRLESREHRAEHVVRIGGQLRSFPAIRVEGRVIWGLTFRIVSDFLGRLAGT